MPNLRTDRQSKEINALAVESTEARMAGETTWEEVAHEVGMRLRRSAASAALGESVEFRWSEHDDSCPALAGSRCECPATYWFRGLRHVVAVHPDHYSEVLSLH